MNKNIQPPKKFEDYVFYSEKTGDNGLMNVPASAFSQWPGRPGQPGQLGFVQDELNASPSNRKLAGMAYDSNRGVVVLFGGEGNSGPLQDTWEWDGNSWSEKSASTFPAQTVTSCLAYDEERQETVLFTELGETWVWNGFVWSQKITATAPSARYNHALTYDPVRKVTVLFGGSVPGDGDSNETWEWDGTSWEQKFPITSPSTRKQMAMAYEGNGQVVLLGGYDTSVSDFLSDMWRWNGVNWIELTPQNMPSAYQGSAMVNFGDSSNPRVVLFGGFIASLFVYYNETWEWNGEDETWTRLLSASKPSPRYLFNTACYDSQRSRMVIFGGAIPTEIYNDTWEWDGSTWIRRATRNEKHYVVNLPFEFNFCDIKYKQIAASIDGDAILIDPESGTYEEGDFFEAAGIVYNRRGGELAYDMTNSNIKQVFESNEKHVVIMPWGDQFTTSYSDPTQFAGLLGPPTSDYFGLQMPGDDEILRQGLMTARRRSWLPYNASDYAVRYCTTSTPDGRAFIVRWNVSSGHAFSSVTHDDVFPRQLRFEVVLHESGKIQYRYEKRPEFMPSPDSRKFDDSAYIQQFLPPPPEAQKSSAMCYDQVRKNVIMKGGYDNSDQPIDYIYERDGLSWRTSVIDPLATGPSATKAVYDVANSRTTIVTPNFDGTEQLVCQLTPQNSWELKPPASTSPDGRELYTLCYDPSREYSVLFGGSEINSSTYPTDTWLWDGNDWTRSGLVPDKRSRASICYDKIRNVTVVYGGITQTGSPLNDTWEWNGVSWTLIPTVTTPGAAMSEKMVYDEENEEMLLIITDISEVECWVWDGTDWTFKPTLGAPSNKQGSGIAYDPVRKVVVLFGGNESDETWELNGTTSTWTLETPATSTPEPRMFCQLAYDGSKLILFGGSGAFNQLNDTWTWDGTDWTQLSPANSPPPRLLPDQQMISTNGKVLLISGIVGSSPALDAWEWDGTNWTQVTQQNYPVQSDMYGFTTAYDVVRDKVVLFGGVFDFLPFDRLNDTWELAGNTWEHVAGEPEPREWSASAYDSVRNEVILFGGSGAYNALNDTWSWNGYHWHKMLTTSSPQLRFRHTLCQFDDKVILFGGMNDTGQLNDTWEWNGTSWIQKTPTTNPPYLILAATTYDVDRNRLVMFGGYYGDVVNQTWEWDGEDWSNVTGLYSWQSKMGASVGIFANWEEERFRDFSSGLGTEDSRTAYQNGGFLKTAGVTFEGEVGLDAQVDINLSPVVSSYNCKVKPCDHWPATAQSGLTFNFTPPKSKKKFNRKDVASSLNNHILGSEDRIFDDERTVNFVTQAVSYPAGISSKHVVGKRYKGVSQTLTLNSTGSITLERTQQRSAFEDFLELDEKKLAKPDAFSEYARPELNRLNSSFFFYGNDLTLGEDLFSFTKSLHSKEQIRLSFNVKNETSMVPDRCSMYYFNTKNGEWNVPEHALEDIKPIMGNFAVATGQLAERGIKPNYAATGTMGSYFTQEAIGFDCYGNPIASGSLNVFRNVPPSLDPELTYIPSEYPDPKFRRGNHMSIETGYQLNKTPQSSAELLLGDYPNSVQRNGNYDASQDQVFTLPIQQPFLIEKIVIEVPLTMGENWFADKTYTLPLSASNNGLAYNGSYSEDTECVQYILDEGGPGITFALYCQKPYGRNKKIRDLIARRVVTHSNDLPKIVTKRSHGYDENNNQNMSAFLEGIPTSYNPHYVKASENEVTETCQIFMLPTITNSVKIVDEAVYERNPSRPWPSQEILDRLTQKKTKTSIPFINAVDTFGRAMTGFSPSGGSIFGREYLTDQSLSSNGSHINNFYCNTEEKLNEAIDIIKDSFVSVEEPDMSLHFYDPVSLVSEKISPYLIMPGESIVLAAAKSRPAIDSLTFNVVGNPTDSSDSFKYGKGILTSKEFRSGITGHDVKLSTGEINIVLYGSYVQLNQEIKNR